MIVVDLDPASVARIRIAPSPVYELTCWLAWTAAGRRHPTWGDPGATARSVLREPTVAAAAALTRGSLSGRYVPDFLTPKPGSADETPVSVLRDQLDRVRATPEAAVVDQVVLAEAPLALTAAAAHLPALVAAGLERFWSVVLAERWSTLSRALDHELDARADAIAATGLGTALGSLHPALRWHDGQIQVDKPYREQLSYADTEIVLVPSVLASPRRLAAQLCDPAEATLSYWVPHSLTQEQRSGRTRYAELFGGTRSAVLAATAAGATTQQLAQQLGLAPATVSRQLRVLHDAGLVDSQRQGHSVRYTQTKTARQLFS